MLKQIILMACWSSSVSKRATFCISGAAYLCRSGTTHRPGIPRPGTLVSPWMAATFISTFFSILRCRLHCLKICVSECLVFVLGHLGLDIQRTSVVLAPEAISHRTGGGGERRSIKLHRVQARLHGQVSFSTAISGDISPSFAHSPSCIYLCVTCISWKRECRRQHAYYTL